MIARKVQQSSVREEQNNESEGGFSQVVHEITEKLMRTNLTSREQRVVWFLVREILGYSLREKIIKTGKFIRDTALPKQHCIGAINTLLQKGIILRSKIDGLPGEYLYSFNDKFFERTCITKNVKDSYVEGGKVIHIQSYKSPNQRPESHRNNAGVVTEAVTRKPCKPAPSADSGGSKETLNKEKQILRGGIGESFTLFGGAESGKMGTLDLSSHRKKIDEQTARCIASGLWEDNDPNHAHLAERVKELREEMKRQGQPCAGK